MLSTLSLYYTVITEEESLQQLGQAMPISTNATSNADRFASSAMRCGTVLLLVLTFGNMLLQ